MKKTIILSTIILSYFHSHAQSWLLAGNLSTTPPTDFIGTTDNQPLVIKTNNTEALRINTNGSITQKTTSGNGNTAYFSDDYYYGGWLSFNSQSLNPSVGSGFRMRVNNTIKSQLFYNGGAFSFGTTLDGLAGNTDILSRTGDVFLSTGTFKSNGLIVKNGTGNIGIGTLAPNNKVEITHGTADNSGLRFTNLTSSSTAAASSGKVLSVNSDGDVVLELAGGGSPYWTASGSDIYNNNTANVGIGTTTPQYKLDVNGTARVIDRLIVGNDTYTFSTNEYRLAVRDGIITERVNIRLRTKWPDYVFSNNYPLQPLNQVEDFIKQNKHLPGIPSAEEVKKEGIEVGETSALLLKKIEELTLYLIEANKEIKELKERMDKQEKKD